MSNGSMADVLVSTEWSSKNAVVGTPNHVEQDLKRLAIAVKHAARYRIDREANLFIRHVQKTMMDKPGQVEHVNMPAGLCFFELPWDSVTVNGEASREGLLFIGRRTALVPPDYSKESEVAKCLTEGSTKEGTLIVVCQTKGGSVMCTSGYIDFRDGKVVQSEDGPITDVFHRIDQTTADQLTTAMGEEDTARFIEDTGFFTAALAAVLTSPKVVNIRESDFGKLNKARARNNRPPLLSQRDVLISLPKPEQTRTVQPGAPDPADAKRGKVRHFVSVFTRLRRGKIELVSPHWRGDASIGVKMPSYYAKGK